MPGERPRISSQSLAGLLAGAPSDADLLARFVGSRDEFAFELLLRRHAALVLATCRRVLADPNDADDAFQATFLVLARKAGSISQKEVIAGWLHRVALRAALRVRATRARRARREQAGVDDVTAPSVSGSHLPELYRVLDEELGRLPAHHRAAFILCCLEGKTGEEAGQLLGCPPGTVSSRLTRARERLRQRLVRRGFAPVGVGAFILAGDSLAAPPAALVTSTLPAALAFASGRRHALPPDRPKVIAEGVLRTMLLNKLRFVPVAALGLLLTGAVLIGTGSGAGPEATPPRKRADDAPKATDAVKEKPAPPKVHVVRPKPGGLERMTRQAATAEPIQKSDLYPAATGQLKVVMVNIGDKIKAGQTLAEIDAPDLVLGEKQAQIALEQAESLLREAEAGRRAAQAAVKVAEGKIKQRETEEASAKATLDYRKKQFERIKQLVETKSVEQKLLDEQQDQLLAAQGQADAAKVAVNTAQADLEASKAKVSQAEAAMATARSNVNAAKLGLERARLAVERATIKAPFDGVVTRCNVSVGDAVRAGEASTPPLMTVMRTDIIRVVVGVPQQFAAKAKPGVDAELAFDAFPNRVFKAKIARVGFAIEPKTRTMRVEFGVPNPEGDLRPGMTGQATIHLGQGPAKAVTIPGDALFSHPHTGPHDKERFAVYVYRDGKAHLTPVRTSLYHLDNEYEVLSGLGPDDLVIADQRDVRGDGTFVTVETGESRK